MKENSNIAESQRSSLNTSYRGVDTWHFQQRPDPIGMCKTIDWEGRQNLVHVAEIFPTDFQTSYL